ncbi:MAG TPA: A/G-specific adenine glycosylase [Thermoanaerobaculia bacterium]|nr:A/G-specific adenine glycosylase [Thermoanaerobaculia bacterium]
MTDRTRGRALLRWYRVAGRDLPWRRTKDPWAVWVSEIMLQQTTVATVAPRWKRFLARFPTVEALGRAPEREVLAAWAGLGYYARARNLRRAARAVARAGAFPRTLDGWSALPGVGPYTAAAVASICFRVPAAVVDGNVARVLARVHALCLDPKSAAGKRRIRAAADATLVSSSPGDSNQALMELGATICTPRAPRCELCPIRAGCLGRQTGKPESFPKTSKTREPRTVHLVAGLAFRSGRMLLVEDGHLVRGQLCVPLFRVPARRRPATVLRRNWEDVAGRKAATLEPLGALRHSVMNRRYLVDVFALEEETSPPPFRESEAGRPRASRGATRPGVRLLRPRELSLRPHGGLLLKVLDLVGKRPSES